MKNVVKYLKYCVFPFIFIYLEVLYKISVGSKFSVSFIYPVISALTLGIFVHFLSSLTNDKINKIVGYTLTVIVCLMFCVQIIYTNTFISPFSLSIAFGGAEGVVALTEFTDIALGAVVSNIVWIIMAFVPITFLIFASRKLKIFRRAGKRRKVKLLIGGISVHVMGLLALLLSGNKGYTPKVLYYDRFVIDIAFDKLGVITSTKLDFKTFVFGVSEKLDDIEGEQKIPDLKADEEKTNQAGKGEDETKQASEQTPCGPNILNIDFKAFSQSTSDENLKWLNDYIQACEPTMKNEYTGMFEGYNVILITAESFSPWAVSEKYTPTLYKLVNSGFVFNNFYTHGYTATTVGEYILCTGLLPNGRGSASPFDNTVNEENKYMGMCMGCIMQNLGYVTYAYHNHTYTYYNRDETHPNMGYIYKGYGNGLDVKYTWPESDLDMMEKSIDDYISEEHFHAYYMTVSGHMNYTFFGNMMAYINKDAVADMDDTEGMKAYMACNIELDKALEYLIKRLEEEGVADKTVIAMATDHYPYGLETELKAKLGDEAYKWYGIQKSNLILWSASMKEPVYVDKVCSSADVVPTLLNLLGIDYDSRLYSGKDILSDSPGLVVFNDMGFMTDYCIYNAKTGEVKETAGVAVPKDYINKINSLIVNMWNAAGEIIETDYYARMKDYIVK